MTTVTDKNITDYVASRPWLKMILTIAMALLGAANGRGWFSKRYGIE